MKQVRFEFEELPYETLSQFGLTQEMIEDLPMHVLEELSHGRHSPVLPIKVSDEQQKQLRSGKVILAATVTADGRKTKAFVQIDTETNQVMSVPTQVIARNLQVLAEELKLSNAEIKVMQQGEPLTFVMQDEPVTVGISLHEKDGIRFCPGDTKKWSEQTKREWDKYTFGCYGCWMMDNDGNLDYVPEEEYTEELWNEQKKSAQRNMGAGLHK